MDGTRRDGQQIARGSAQSEERCCGETHAAAQLHVTSQSHQTVVQVTDRMNIAYGLVRETNIESVLHGHQQLNFIKAHARYPA
jgi:hypothetical protein